MNEQDSLSERDRETLERVDSLVASPQARPDGAVEVALLLVNTVPQSDAAFQSRLEAQLLAKLDGKAMKARKDGLARPGNPGSATFFRRVLPASIPLSRAASRLGSVLVGAAMAAALVLALTFLLQSRRDTPIISTEGTATANALATLTASSSNLTPDYPVTIKTALLPVSVIAWSPDSRSSTSAIAWSGDGRTLASAAPDGKVSFWNAATGEKLREIDTSATGNLRGIEWSPDGAMLATHSDSPSSGWGFVDLWDPVTGEKLHSFTEQQGRITSIDWSPDGKLLAWTDGWSIRLWDRETESTLPKPQPTWPALIADLGIEPNFTTNLKWSPDGTRLATSQGNIVKVWDPSNGQELAALTHNGPAVRMEWSHDGSRLAVLVAGDPTQLGGAAASLVLWDTVTNRQVDSPVVEGSVTSIDWLPRGLVLAMSGVDDKTADDYVSRYDAITAEFVRITDGRATELAWSPDNQTLAIVNSGDGLIRLLNGFAEVIPSPTPSVASTILPTSTGCCSAVTPSVSPAPRVLHDCWDGWDVSVGPNTDIVGTKSGSDILLADVAAIDYSDVWAVGSSRDSDALSRTLTAHWDGEKWTVIPSPNKNDESGYQALHAVAAFSSTDVWAVGDYTSSNAAPQETLIQHWDGTKWSIVRSPSPGSSNSLTAVAAASTSDAWAVGYTVDSDGPMASLILHWDGQKWSMVPTPTFDAPEAISGLQAVVAISANDAWAVGWSHSDSAGESSSGINVGTPLTMHWDGKEWNVVPVAGVENAQLTGISVSPIGDLWAIGYKANGNDTEPLVLHWDEVRWNIVPTPKLKRSDTMYKIKVITGEDIWAIGAYAMHWDGRTWTVHSGLAWPDIHLSGMAVFWRTDIWAVGALLSNPQQPVVLNHSTSYPCALVQTPSVAPPAATATMLRTPGGATPSIPLPVATSVPTAIPVATSGCDPRWDIVRLMGTDSAEVTSLVDLAAISENDVWAIGSRRPSDPNALSSQTLAMHWNGTNWTIVPTPNKGEGLNSLKSISALASNEVWALGSYTDVPGKPYETLVLHWNGTEWAIMPTPSPDQYNSLWRIDALAKDDIWAIGGPVLTMHWDDRVWSAVPTPKVGKYSSNLNALVAIASDDVWAVGSYRDIRPTQEAPIPGSALTMHWNGRAWTVVPVPDSSITDLTGITATGPTEVWAIGTRQRDQLNMMPTEMAVLRWDGSKWSTVPIPKIEMANSRPNIVAMSAQDVWAFGSRTLHWDGTRWARVFEPQIEVTDWTGNHIEDVPLYDAAVTPSGTVWALGGYMWDWDTSLQVIARYNNSPCSSPAPGAPKP